MTDQIKVSVEIDKLKAEHNLRDLSRQLSSVDNLINQLTRTGVTWASDFKTATEKVREKLDNVGGGLSKLSNDGVKSSKKLRDEFKALTDQINRLDSSVSKVGRNFLTNLSAAKLPITAGLRDDDNKRRTAHLSNLQKQYQKEQQALQQHQAKQTNLSQAALAKSQAQFKNREAARLAFHEKERNDLQKRQATFAKHWAMVNSINRAGAIRAAEYRVKSIGQLSKDLPNASVLSSTKSLGGAKAVAAAMKEQETATKKAEAARKAKTRADQEALRTGVKLADSSKRIGIASLNQAGSVNKLASAWKLAKQNMAEGISIANLFQTAARGLTAAVSGLVFKFVEWVKFAPTLASDMLGFRNALQLVTGSQAEASSLLNKAVDIAVRLKLSITSVTKEYSKFINSATIAGLSVEKATHTFESFSIAARVLNLNQQRTSGMFLALEQMVSKGRVSMEELRRQLGEHIPGALNLAAQAMGYGRDELGKFIKEVSSGNVVSIELVENLGKLLRGRTEKLLPEALKKFSAAVQNLTNAFTQLGLQLGELIAKVLGPAADGLATVVRAFSAWLPAAEVLSGANAELGEQLSEVNSTITSVTETVNVLTGSEQQLAEETETASTQIKTLKEEMDGFGIAGVAMIGTVGTAGLGGALALLGKGLSLIKSGLKTFGSAVLRVLSPIKGLMIALGAGGLSAILVKLYGLYVSLIGIIVRFGLTLAAFVVINPYGALATAVAALTAGLYLAIEGHDELEERQSKVNKNFVDMAAETKSANTALEEIKATMADFGQVELVVTADAVQKENQKLQRRNQYLAEGLKAKEEEVGFWDEQLDKIGYVTDDMAAYRKELQEVATAQSINNGLIKEGTVKTEELKEEAKKVTLAFESIKTASQAFVDNFKIEKLELELSLIGKDKVRADIAQIYQDAAHEVAKLNAENGNPVANQAEIERINRARDLRIEIVKNKAAYESYRDTIKSFESAASSLDKTVTGNIVSLEQAAMAIGKTGFELDQLNSQFKIAALEQKANKLATEATTTAQLQQVAAIRQQVETIKALHQNLNLLKEEERKRQKQLQEQKQAISEFNTLRKQGQDILNKTLPLEARYRKAWDEMLPKLAAAGASQEQLATASKQLWAQIVDDADNGLRSMEALSEEFAKAMQNNFSDFFFDAMKGDFDNIETAFTDMLFRMVAEAAATNLSKHLMSPSGGGGILDSILSSGTVQSLFNIAPPMPVGGIPGVSPSTGIMQMGGGGLVNLPGFATGGDFTVGGTGGTDSQVVAFRATPGENVRVRPPSKGSAMDGPSGTTILNFNVTTPDAESFGASRPHLEVELRQMMENAGRNI